MDAGQKPTIVTYCVIISGNVFAFHMKLKHITLCVGQNPPWPASTLNKLHGKV